MVNHAACRPSGNAIAGAAHLSSVFPSICWSGHKVRTAQQGNLSHMRNMTTVLLLDVSGDCLEIKVITITLLEQVSTVRTVT